MLHQSGLSSSRRTSSSISSPNDHPVPYHYGPFYRSICECNVQSQGGIRIDRHSNRGKTLKTGQGRGEVCGVRGLRNR
jgi:hypothetical protein